jgi:Ca-activated chloride channel homolog
MRFAGRLSLLLLLLSGTIRVPAAVAQSADPAAEPPAPASGAPVSTVPAIPAELDQRHQDFLAQVAPLMSDKEREVFLSLQQDYQRDSFIRRFWQARDPYPQTAVNEFQARWEENARTIKERFPDPKDARIEVLLAFGEPADTVVSRCSDVLLPTEVWLYPKGTQGVRGSFAVAFYSPLGASRGRYQSWVPGDGLLPLLAFEARARAGPGFGLRQLAQSCSGGGDLVAGALSEAIDWRDVVRAGAALPKPTDEWLRTFQSYSTDLPDGAGTFAAELDLSYPGRQQSRTVVQGLLAVPREAVQPLELGGSRLYAFLVDGEVVRKGELFEHFRYRFTMPEKEALALGAARIPVVFQRLLRPGAYTLVLKVEDLGGKRFFRAERELDVPVAPTAPAAPAAVAAAPPGAPGSPETGATDGQPAPAPGSRSTGDLLAEANATVAVPSLLAAGPDIRAGGEATVQLVSPGDGLLTGRTRIQAVTTGDAVARVSFELDGKPVLAKSKPPWSIEIALGDQPRLHRVVAVAHDAAGGELARDELLLNAGPHRFAARLVEPQRGRTYKSSLRAQVEVEVPEGETLERVELYLNDTLVATHFQPPFVQPILLPAGQELTYVRAVAYLEGGTTTEDLVVVNAPDLLTEVEVDLVELFTTVVDRKGRPVDGVTQEEFKVVEDGVEQKLRRFEVVHDLPIYVGVLIDTSGSMNEELDEAVQGALQFFHKVITPKDRAAVFTFSDKPSLAVRFTNDLEVLAGGVASLTAEGNTALHDSVIFALHYFGGIRGRRALILLSDGRDEGSRYGYNDALEYARRAGVTLYTVGINLTGKDGDVRLKLQRLAEETGGRAFFIERALNLDRVYEAVEGDLRSQYLLAYESTQSGKDSEKYRTVEVKVARPGLEAKTLRGYYP